MGAGWGIGRLGSCSRLCRQLAPLGRSPGPWFSPLQTEDITQQMPVFLPPGRLVKLRSTCVLLIRMGRVGNWPMRLWGHKAEAVSFLLVPSITTGMCVCVTGIRTSCLGQEQPHSPPHPGQCENALTAWALKLLVFKPNSATHSWVTSSHLTFQSQGSPKRQWH